MIAHDCHPHTHTPTHTHPHTNTHTHTHTPQVAERALALSRAVKETEAEQTLLEFLASHQANPKL